MLKRLESGHQTPGHDLSADPYRRADSVENEVAGNFPEDDPESEQLLPVIELGLCDPNVLQEVIRESISDVP